MPRPFTSEEVQAKLDTTPTQYLMNAFDNQDDATVALFGTRHHEQAKVKRELIYQLTQEAEDSELRADTAQATLMTRVVDPS